MRLRGGGRASPTARGWIGSRSVVGPSPPARFVRGFHRAGASAGPAISVVVGGRSSPIPWRPRRAFRRERRRNDRTSGASIEFVPRDAGGRSRQTSLTHRRPIRLDSGRAGTRSPAWIVADRARSSPVLIRRVGAPRPRHAARVSATIETGAEGHARPPRRLGPRNSIDDRSPSFPNSAFPPATAHRAPHSRRVSRRWVHRISAGEISLARHSRALGFSSRLAQRSFFPTRSRVPFPELPRVSTQPCVMRGRRVSLIVEGGL